MEGYIYLVFCLVISSYLADGSQSGSWIEKWKGDDIDAHAERPCSHNDLNCVRRYFAKHSHCRVTHGPTPEHVLLNRLTFPLANPNITMILNDVKVSGLDGKVVEFTINKKTNNLVIAAEMRDITIYSPKTTFRYHRKMKEPVVLSDELYITYDSVTLTAVIPNIDDMEVTKMEVFSYIANDNPTYALGPGFIKSLDMDVIRSFNKLVNNIPEVIKEVFIFQGPLFMVDFLQNNICDFGIKVTISNSSN